MKIHKIHDEWDTGIKSRMMEESWCRKSEDMYSIASKSFFQTNSNVTLVKINA